MPNGVLNPSFVPPLRCGSCLAPARDEPARHGAKPPRLTALRRFDLGLWLLAGAHSRHKRCRIAWPHAIAHKSNVKRTFAYIRLTLFNSLNPSHAYRNLLNGHVRTPYPIFIGDLIEHLVLVPSLHHPYIGFDAYHTLVVRLTLALFTASKPLECLWVIHCTGLLNLR